MADGSLPTPRALLTSLTNALSSIPPAAGTTPQQLHPSNPLKFLPPSQARPLLATLHTLYPNVLLTALDLLDRRLVTRIAPEPAAAPPDVPMEAEAEAEGDGDTPLEEPNFFYLVRSAREPSRRGRRGAPAAEVLNEGAGPTYVVQTRAWNCSCAAFAFSAFPAESATPVYHISSTSASALSLSRRYNAGSGRYEDEKGARKDVTEEAWEFGGMSRDGLDPRPGDAGMVGTGGVPCCKHLLACVLAERWREVLGGYVTEWRAGKEEAAGLVAGI